MITLLRTEWQKQKKARLVLALCAAFGTFAFGTYVMLLYLQSNDYSAMQSWLILLDTFNILIKTIVIISITLAAVLIMDDEHRTGMWSRLQLFPVAKWKYFVVKLGSLTILMNVLAILLVLGAHFGASFAGHSKIVDLICGLYVPFLLALPFIVFQTWMAMVYKNPLLPIAVGVIMFLFLNLFVGWGIWLPWGVLATYTFDSSTQSTDILMAGALVLVLTTVYFTIGLQHFKTKEFS